MRPESNAPDVTLKVIPVILCGGAGTRLWPLSREAYPKQLLSLVDDKSLLQNTILRCAGHPDVTEPVLVCNEAHRFLVAEQLREIGIQNAKIMLEPEARNTAPAVAIAAHDIFAAAGDGIMVVLPSDHVIQRAEQFTAALTQAIALAESGKLVTFGIVPDRPETGYGYIRRGDAIDEAYRVDRFVEKPDADTASEFFESDRYYWNSGMFVFKASAYLAELEQQNAAIAEATRAAVAGAAADLDFMRVDQAAFKQSPSDSIDYAVMEHTRDAVVVPLDAGWSDIGSWDALYKVLEKDSNNNSLVGDVVVDGVKDTLVMAEHRLVSLVGVKDLVVVETADAVMVASQAKSQDVKAIVARLQASEREERTTHRKVYRPWGYYESIDSGPGYQVKRIGVNPGASLSLQLHHHRAEHWIVVRGQATVTCGESVSKLNPNESTYIPVETQHRLQNLTAEPVEIIEVQSGSYLGEDDIVRLEDDYGR